MGHGENNNCPSCGKIVTHQKYFSTENMIKDGELPFCREKIQGIGTSGKGDKKCGGLPTNLK